MFIQEFETEEKKNFSWLGCISWFVRRISPSHSHRGPMVCMPGIEGGSASSGIPQGEPQERQGSLQPASHSHLGACACPGPSLPLLRATLPLPDKPVAPLEPQYMSEILSCMFLLYSHTLPHSQLS